jgi:tetratricopeptide (TPR) repeat protein
LQHAQRYLAEGQPLRIASESEWLSFIGLDDRLATRAQIYTPASISQLLKVSVQTVRRWERLGLIQPVRRVHRLPYFDLRQVASAQRLAELLAAGIPAAQVRDSLQKLTPWVGDSTAALTQLELLEQRKELAYRDRKGRLVSPNGQRLLEFEPVAKPPATDPHEDHSPPDERAQWGRGEWFEEGQRLSAEGQLAPASEALRMSLMLDYDFPEVHFQLADLLYQQGHERAALERYYMAVELDRDYPEAWTQIGCVHAGLNETDQALLAFEIALNVHPDYAEAHFHRAEALWKQGQFTSACQHFAAYLEHDQQGPWAELAQSRLDAAPTAKQPS